MVRDLKKVIIGHIEKGVLAICFLIFVIVLILQLTGGRENPGKVVEEHIEKIEQISRSVEVPKKNVVDSSKKMVDYWKITGRKRAQTYTTTPFVILPGPMRGPQKELKALPPEKVTVVAGIGRNVVVVDLPSLQAELVHRASFEGKVLFNLYRKKGDDKDYTLAVNRPYEALESFQRQNYLYGILKDKLQKNKPFNAGELDLAVALGLITSKEAEEIKKRKKEAPKPTPARVRGARQRQGRTTGTLTRRSSDEERYARIRELDRRRELAEEAAEARAERGGYEPGRERRSASVPTVRPLTVARVKVSLAEALSNPLTLEDTDVEPGESYQYKVEVILEGPERSTRAMSVASNMAKALSDIKIYLRGGTELFGSIEVYKWVAEVESWISKSFQIKPGEAIGYPVMMTLKDENSRFFVDANGKYIKRKVDFSTDYTLVDLENRVKFDPEKGLTKSPTLRMAYLNPRGGLEYKWTERRRAAAIAAGAAQAVRARSSRR